MRILVFFLFLFLAYRIFPQPTFSWVVASGNSQIDQGHTIAVDASGNVYISGLFTGTVDFDPGPGTTTLSSFIPSASSTYFCKYNSIGTLIWAKKMEGARSVDMAIDPSGNVYIMGYYYWWPSADIDPGPGIFTLTLQGTCNVFIGKYDPSGNLIWGKGFGANQTIGSAISIDPFGNILTCGYFDSPTDFDPGPGTFSLSAAGQYDAFISKLDNSGNFIFAKRIGGVGHDDAASISTDGFGNIYLAGFFAGIIDVDPGPATYTFDPAGGSQRFILKLNSNGIFMWAKQMDFVLGSEVSSTGDVIGGIVADANGNSFISGMYTTTDFDPGPSTYSLTANSGGDIFILKLDPFGNFVWVTSFGATQSEVIKSIKLDNLGYIYTTGKKDATTITGNGNIYFSKHDPLGNIVWLSTITANSGNTMSAKLAVDNNAIYSTGYYQTTVDFDPGPATVSFTPLSPTNYDFFALKLNHCTNTSTLGTILGNTSLCIGSQAIFSLSPVSGATSYSWTLPSGWSGSSLNNTISVVAGTTGVIYVKALDGCGPTIPQSATININPNPVITVNNGYMCNGNSFTIIPSGALTYSFSGGSSVVSPIVNSTYTITGTNAAGCIDSIGVISTVSVQPLPNISVLFSNNTILCDGDSVVLIATGANSYTWSTGTTGNTTIITPSASSSFSISGEDLLGCSNTAIFFLNVYPKPTLSITSNNTLSCPGQMLSIMASGAFSYTWLPIGMTGSVINYIPFASETYSCYAVDSLGCTNTTTFSHSIIECTDIKEYASNSINVSVYHNAGQGQFVIMSEKTIDYFELIDCFGKILTTHTLNRKEYFLSDEKLTSSIYLLKIYINGNAFVKKIIVY